MFGSQHLEVVKVRHIQADWCTLDSPTSKML